VVPYSVVVGYQHFRGPCCLPSSGWSDLWNVGILPQHYTAPQPRRPQLDCCMNCTPQH